MKTSYKNQRGMTLIEILISIGVLALIASIGLFISMDFLRGGSAHSEQEKIVSILQSARSQSLNNIDQVRHGVHFEAGPKYVVFQCELSPPATLCTDYSGADTSKDLTISSSYNVSINNPPNTPALPFDIIFNQLNGDCVSCTSPISITMNDGVRDYNIIVNSEGQIDWN